MTRKEPSAAHVLGLCFTEGRTGPGYRRYGFLCSTSREREVWYFPGPSRRVFPSFAQRDITCWRCNLGLPFAGAIPARVSMVKTFGRSLSTALQSTASRFLGLVLLWDFGALPSSRILQAASCRLRSSLSDAKAEASRAMSFLSRATSFSTSGFRSVAMCTLRRNGYPCRCTWLCPVAHGPGLIYFTAISCTSGTNGRVHCRMPNPVPYRCGNSLGIGSGTECSG